MEAGQRNGVDIKLTTILQKVGKRWKTNDLVKFKAVIVFPYAVLSYFLNDIYASCVPLFVPSPSFLASLRLMNDYRNTQQHYCPYASSLPQHKNSNHTFSPESGSIAAQVYWFKFATFYTPASIQFDSWDDLANKLKSIDLHQKFWERRRENSIIMDHNKNMWHQIMKRIQKRKMPTSYEDALHYFNTTSFY